MKEELDIRDSELGVTADVFRFTEEEIRKEKKKKKDKRDRHNKSHRHHRHHSGDHYTSEHRIDRHGNIDSWSEHLHNDHTIDYSGKDLLNNEHINELIAERHGDRKNINDHYNTHFNNIDDLRNNSKKMHD